MTTRLTSCIFPWHKTATSSEAMTALLGLTLIGSLSLFDHIKTVRKYTGSQTRPNLNNVLGKTLTHTAMTESTKHWPTPMQTHNSGSATVEYNDYTIHSQAKLHVTEASTRPAALWDTCSGSISVEIMLWNSVWYTSTTATQWWHSSIVRGEQWVRREIFVFMHTVTHNVII